MGIEEIDGGVTYEVAQWYPAHRGLRRRPRLEHRAVLRAGRVLPGVRQLRRQPHGARRHDRRGDGYAPESGGGADRRRSAPASRRPARARPRSSSADPDEVGDPASRPADAVRDAHLAVHRRQRARFRLGRVAHFVWDAVGVNGGKTLAMSFYPPSAEPLWKEATQYAKTAIENYSAQWAPYPYPVASNVHGIEGGMEYPMIVFCNRPDAGGAVQRHRPRVRPHLVPHGGGQQRAALRLDGRGVQRASSTTTTGRKKFGLPPQPPRRGARTTSRWRARAGAADHDPRRPDPGQLGPAAYNKPAIALRLLCGSVVLGPSGSIPRSGSTSAAGPTSTPRRRTSSGPWRTGWART